MSERVYVLAYSLSHLRGLEKYAKIDSKAFKSLKEGDYEKMPEKLKAVLWAKSHEGNNYEAKLSAALMQIAQLHSLPFYDINDEENIARFKRFVNEGY